MESDNSRHVLQERTLFRPNKYWGPALPQHRKLVTYVENFDVDPWQTEEMNMNEMGDSVRLHTYQHDRAYCTESTYQHDRDKL